MRLPAPLFMLLATTVSGLALAATPPKPAPKTAPAATPAPAPAKTGGIDASPAEKLTGNKCLNPTQVRATLTLSDREIYVDGGRYKYRIVTEADCSDLDDTVDVAFRGGAMSRMVCGGGDVREAVISRRDVCRIGRIEIVDKKTYDKVADAHLQAHRNK